MRLYRAPRLFDGTGAPPVTDAAVLIGDEGRIVAAGPASKVTAGGAEIVDCQGTLLPGLIDAHVHLCLSGEADPVAQLTGEPRVRTVARAVQAMARYLAAGVTTVRDLGGVDDLAIELGRMVAEGQLLGPRVVAAGRVVCITGGHCFFFGREADGPEAVVHAVREEIKAGADCIKVIATGGMITPGTEPGAQQMSRPEIEAAVETAHRAGRRVAAHAHGTSGIRDAVAAGCDTIEHGLWLDEAAVAAMRERGIFLVPTFSATLGILSGKGRGVPDETVAKMEQGAEAQATSFRLALEAGVPIAAGSDAGTPFNAHGALAGEVKAMIDEGMPILDALAACTGRAADALGLPDVGRLVPGHVADLIEVDGDPAADPAALARVRRVVQGGVERPLAAVSAVAPAGSLS
jgi:imidazolonepropionase-like amidohydrolase